MVKNEPPAVAAFITLRSQESANRICRALHRCWQMSHIERPEVPREIGVLS